MTFKILNSSTNKIINRSNVRSANDSKFLKLRANPITSPKVIASLRGDHSKDKDSTSEPTSSNLSSTKYVLIVDPQDLVGRDFLLDK